MSHAFRVLVVDDDRLGRTTTKRQLESVGYTAQSADGPYSALEALADNTWDVVLTDFRMPGMDGLELLKEIKRTFPDIVVILMTAYGTVETAVAAIQAGAADVLTKPFQFEELDLRLRRIFELRRTQAEVKALREILHTSSEQYGLIGRCPQILEVRARIRQFADHTAPLLITGETGTGKEVVARAIHQAGSRSQKRFVAVGCGTIPKELAESELFGHEKGAFTGATQQRQGSFELADGGTLLLDDVDDLPLDIQVKLLRVLQDGTFNRVGGPEEYQVDVRVVATTKADLEQEVAEKRFRDDLFYRLRGLEILLPPLRERGDDVLLLTSHFLQVMAASEAGQTRTISAEAAAYLKRFPWPGNVRELRRALESAAVLCEGMQIQPEHLPDFLRKDAVEDRLFSLHLQGASALPLPELVNEFEQAVLAWAMRRAGGRQTKAAEILGIPRTTLQSKLAIVKTLIPRVPGRN